MSSKKSAEKSKDGKEKKTIIEEFKAFISRGNVIDLAVGLVVGGAFTAIVKSLVNDLLMPLIGWLFGGINFTHLKFVIRPAADGRPEAALMYGNFIQSTVNFLLISIVVFLLIKMINTISDTLFQEQLAKEAAAKKKAEEEAKAEAEKPTRDQILLSEIRDLLKANQTLGQGNAGAAKAKK